MKTVTHVSLGGRSFILDEDAYKRLKLYFEHFRAKLSVPDYQKGEVMEEIEGRIAELFYQEVGEGSRVVSLEVTERVIATLGMPDGSPEDNASASGAGSSTGWTFTQNPDKKLFRDMDGKYIGGVCSGLAQYFDVDVTLVRIIMLIALIFGSAGFWVYVILWIAVPAALTPAQKCQMHGIPVSAENMARFASSNK